MITNVYFNVSCNQQYLTVVVDVNKTKHDYMFNVTFDIKVPIDTVMVSIITVIGYKYTNIFLLTDDPTFCNAKA